MGTEGSKVNTACKVTSVPVGEARGSSDKNCFTHETWLLQAFERVTEGHLRAAPAVRNTGLEEASPPCFLYTGIGVAGSQHPNRKDPSCAIQPCAAM